jgi:hypothetical protein
MSPAEVDIQISAQINGWPEEDAKQVARRMSAGGVTPMGARHLLAANARVWQ